MRRQRLFPLPALTVVGLLILSGCSGGDARSLGPVPTAPTTTTTEPVTSTTPPTTATTVAPTTTRPAAATATTAAPRLVNGIPQVTATPARAPIGGRVRIEGTGFTDPMWRVAEAPLWLVGQTPCHFFAQATHSVTVSAAGRLTGEFTVPVAGGCRMSEESSIWLTAGAYRIVFVCTPCTIGELEVTTSAGPCADVAFAPNSDNLASAIFVAGMDCAEGEAIVRKAGAQAGAVNGPARLNVDGFLCIRTAQSDRGLPSADYECTNGSKLVRFHRT